MSLASKTARAVVEKSAMFVIAANLLMPSASLAEEVTLRSVDGAINIVGQIISVEENAYVVQSAFGDLRVQADAVECIGAACPDKVVDFATLKPVTWSVSLWGKPRAFTEHVEKLAELVSEKTEGQFRLNLSYGGLSPSRENLDRLSQGAFEMAQFCAGYHPDKNPSITVLELPFLGVDTMEQELEVSKVVYGHPAVVKDFERWNATLLMPTPQPQYNIAGAGSPPTSLEAFEALTVRATGGIGAAIEALGASSVSIPAPNVQDALASGEVNAVAFAPHAHMAFDTINSAVWWTTNLNPGTANCPIVVNSDALNALPASSRAALLGSVDEALEHFIVNYRQSAMAAWNAELEERAIIKLTFNDGILNAINEQVAGPAAEQWIAKTEALGLPAQELYNLAIATLNADRVLTQ